MQAGSLVVCVKGHPGVITEGEIYTIDQIYKHSAKNETVVLLVEVEAPKPHVGFKEERFVEIQGPMDVTSVVENILQDCEC